MKQCSLCRKEVSKLYRCKYCERAVCKDCLVNSEVGKVCKKCDEEVARQISWESYELDI